MTDFWIIAPLCLLVPLSSAASASFQAQRSIIANKFAKQTSSHHDDSLLRASRAFTASSGPLAALNSPSLDLFSSPANILGEPTLVPGSSLDSSDFLLAAGRTLEETTSKILTYSAMMEEATSKIPVLDATNKLSSYSTLIKGGTSSLGFDGALDGLKINLQSTTDVLQSTTDALNLGQLHNAKQAIGSVAVVDPEKLLSVRQNLIDGVSQQLSSQESVVEFWQWYVASLNERYHFPELYQSLVSGTAFSNAMNEALAVGQTAVDALDIKHQGPIYFFIAAVFLASAQEMGSIKSDQPKKVAAVASEKVLPDEKIKKLEEELKSTKAAAKKESQEKSDEIKELRQQMDTLQTQVVALTEAAAALTTQLEKTAAPAAVEIEPPAEPVVVKPPKDLGKAEKSSKVKGSQKVTAATPAAKKKTKGKAKKVAKTAKKSPKSATKKSEPAPAPSLAPKSAKERVKQTIVVSKADWKSLSESTLKRKTVKELTVYLSEKGVDVSGTDGKTLKKENLVELVQSV